MKLRNVFGITALIGGAVSVGASVYAFCFAQRRKRKEQTKEKESQNLSENAYKKLWHQERNWADTLESEQVSVVTDDGLQLNAVLFPGEKPSKKTVIMIHGYRSNGYREYATFLRFYHQMGMNILLPDNRAHGTSQGRYIGYGWLDRLDLMKWIQLVLDRYGQDSEISLQGVSMGGATVLMASGEDLPAQVKAIVADCPYTSVDKELASVMKQMGLPVQPLLTTAGWISKVVAGYGYKEASALEQVKKSRTPTLFITGDADKFVPTEMTYQLYESCSAPKELLVVPGAAHAQAHVLAKEAYEKRVQDFLEKYL